MAMSHQPKVPDDSLDPLNHIERCHCKKPTGRNIVVCIDGTSGSFGLQLTHVLNLYKHIDKDKSQVAFYHNGMGTPPLLSESKSAFHHMVQRLNQKTDLAVGWNFDNILQTAYIWLSNNYQEGDCIYLFGFSRGAYQVRVLAGIIATLGLVFPNNEVQVPIAYDLYTSLRAEPSYIVKSQIRLFKETFARKDVRVHFLGAWDAMSSSGILKPDLSLLPGDIVEMCSFRHALALDERRVKFLPEYARNVPNHSDDENELSRGLKTDMKEVWFAGTHTDMGLSNSNHPLGAIPFHWMYIEARHFGLRLHPTEQPHLQPTLPNPSLRGLWWFFEYLPLVRLNYNYTNPDETIRLPHRGRGRVVMPGQKIHTSVHSLGPEYVPRAVGIPVQIHEEPRPTDDGWEMGSG
ncbi:hypothetical protein C8R44DRAFT_714716 [Mycena epipterygia]|nr:hypothetical protein C8R44DRAFT_714716 [Mycena epipterygia]